MLSSLSDLNFSSSPVCRVSQLLCSPCGHDPLAGVLRRSCFAMEASLGIQMEEPTAFSPLRDRFLADGSLKKHEQNFKLPGMCSLPKMYRQQFCNFDYLKTNNNKKHVLNLKVSCMFI